MLEWFSETPSAARGSKAWESPALPQRHRPRTPAGSGGLTVTTFWGWIPYFGASASRLEDNDSPLRLLPGWQRRSTGGRCCCSRVQRSHLCCWTDVCSSLCQPTSSQNHLLMRNRRNKAKRKGTVFNIFHFCEFNISLVHQRCTPNSGQDVVNSRH